MSKKSSNFASKINTSMKKFFILAVVALVAMGTNAQNVTKMRVWIGDQVAYQKDIAHVDSITFVQIVDGALSGEFSISEEKKVHFSKGNLQYQATTDTWRFAAEQYDMIGDLNSKISSSYSGWIDLFGWGTGNNPTKSGTASYSYDTFVDWGTNAISNGGNEANKWRTLSSEEWEYILFSRTNAATLFGLGSVNGIKGVILLPDDWQLPKGITFTASTTKGLKNIGDMYWNDEGDNFSHNAFTIEQWYMMEAAGAVFLPAAGYRWGMVMHDVGERGYYYTTTPYNGIIAYFLFFGPYTFHAEGSNNERNCGMSVRLVR